MTTSKQLPQKRRRTAKKHGSRLRLSSKKPNHVDQHVGTRLRLRRNLLDLSQDELARRLGLTAQLIQKYEAGETRISASRLYEISNQLAITITWFFEGLDEGLVVLHKAFGEAPAPRMESCILGSSSCSQEVKL